MLKRIKISNFKNFKNLEIKFDKFNVIVGANSAGKSNLFNALKFIRDIKNYGIENAISLQGGIDFIHNLNIKSADPIEIELEFLPNISNQIDQLSANQIIELNICSITYSLKIIHTNLKLELEEQINYNCGLCFLEEKKDSKDLASMDFKINRKNDKIEFIYPLNFDEKSFLMLPENFGKMAFDINKINPLINITKEYFQNLRFDSKKTILEQFHFLIVNKLIEYPIYEFNIKKAKETAQIIGKIDLEENAENLSLVIKHILEDENERRSFINLISNILPFIEDVNYEKYLDKSIIINFYENYFSESKLPSTLLSDGTISVTALVIALFFGNKDLLFFEEPEVNLHPYLISKIVELFYTASETQQIIITTHSPEIVKYTKLEDLFLLNRDENGFTQIIMPSEKEMVNNFLNNELTIEQLFTQNLLDF